MVRVVKLCAAMLLILAVSSQGSANNNEVELTGPVESVSEGYFRLHVSGLGENTRFRIEMSESEDFAPVLAEYEPVGLSRYLSLSGFDSGSYYFRARSGNSVSNIIQVKVQHYPLWQAFSLFLTGAIMFIVLCVTVVRYHYQTKAVGGY